MQEEILKVVLGLCCMLPYSRRPHGIITTDCDITWIQVELDHANQRIVYKTEQKLIFDRSEKREHETYVPCILEIVKQIAGILFYKQTKIADEVMFKSERDYGAKVAPHITNVTAKLASS